MILPSKIIQVEVLKINRDLKPSKTGPKRTKLTRLKLRSPGGLSSICPSTMAENAKPSLAAKLAENRDLNAENDLAIFGH